VSVVDEVPQPCRGCGALLASDNDGELCSPCQRADEDPLASPPKVPSSFWQEERIQTALEDRHMGRVIRAYRQHRYHGRRGLAQETVAGWLNLTQGQLSRIENGPPIAHLDRLVQCAAVLRIPEQYLWFVLPSSRLDAASRATPAAEAPGPTGGGLERLDELAQATERIRRLRASNVDDETIVRLDHVIERYAQAYEDTGATSLYRSVLRERGSVDELLRGHQSASQRAALFVVAGKLSVLLAHLAFDLGHESLAETYAVEAWTLAELAGQRDLVAHVRGTQSFMAYYRQEYQEALLLARDGAQYARSRPAAIRVAVQEARALARLGDGCGVDRAVERAFDLRSGLDEPDTSTPFLSFAPYDTSRIAGNAATAYLSLGQADKVGHYTGMALPVLEAADAQAGLALTKLDAAASFLLDGAEEPDRAAATVSDAIRAGDGLPSAVIAKRIREFLQMAGRWSRLPAIADVREELDEWQRGLPEPGRNRNGRP
jgi:hypothetical protein